MTKISVIGSVPKADQAGRIAAGLERLIVDIRAGTFLLDPSCCVIVLQGRVAHLGDDFAVASFGAKTGIAEMVGLLELAKLQIIRDAEVDV